MIQLEQLADLLRVFNSINHALSGLLERSANLGNISEIIASEILHIQLEERANHPVFDGTFSSGPLQGKTVNVKWRNEGVKAINMKDADTLPDYFLALAGPHKSSIKTKSLYHPFAIKQVCLFEAVPLVQRLKKEGIAIRHQTRIDAGTWEKARIYPVQEGSPLPLTRTQEDLLTLFAHLDLVGAGA